jgi:hypothetical protein
LSLRLHSQKRRLRVVEHPLGDAAEEETAEPRLPVWGHRDEVDVEQIDRLRYQSIPDKSLIAGALTLFRA